MFSSFSEATAYLVKNLNTYDPNNPFDEAEVRETLFDAVFTSIDDDMLERSLTESDKILLETQSGNEDIVLSILANRIPNFYTLLTDTVAELLHEYMTEDDDDDLS